MDSLLHLLLLFLTIFIFAAPSAFVKLYKISRIYHKNLCVYQFSPFSRSYTKKICICQFWGFENIEDFKNDLHFPFWVPKPPRGGELPRGLIPIKQKIMCYGVLNSRIKMFKEENRNLFL